MVTITASTRETAYSPTTPTTDFPCDFPIFGTGSDDFPVTDLEVEVNGEVTTAFTVVATFADGISTDALVRLNSGVTGDVIVRGKRTPRRTDQYANGAPLPITAHNYSLNRLEAEMQEVRRDTDINTEGLAQEIIDRTEADDEEREARIAADALEAGLRADGDAAEAAVRRAEDETLRSERIAGDQHLQAQIDGINSELDQFDSKIARADAAAETAENAAETAQDLVEAATAGFIGFQDGMAYDWGYISDQTTYFDMNWGSIAA